MEVVTCLLMHLLQAECEKVGGCIVGLVRGAEQKKDKRAGQGGGKQGGDLQTLLKAAAGASKPSVAAGQNGHNQGKVQGQGESQGQSLNAGQNLLRLLSQPEPAETGPIATQEKTSASVKDFFALASAGGSSSSPPLPATSSAFTVPALPAQPPLPIRALPISQVGRPGPRQGSQPSSCNRHLLDSEAEHDSHEHTKVVCPEDSCLTVVCRAWLWARFLWAGTVCWVATPPAAPPTSLPRPQVRARSTPWSPLKQSSGDPPPRPPPVPPPAPPGPTNSSPSSSRNFTLARPTSPRCGRPARRPPSSARRPSPGFSPLQWWTGPIFSLLYFILISNSNTGLAITESD